MIGIKSFLNINKIEDQCTQLVQNSNTILFQSNSWCKFLKKHLKLDDLSFGAFENGQLLAYFPLLSKNGPLGVVANSLPFFGSNGGIVIDNTLSDDKKKVVKNDLINYLEKLRYERNITSTTIITSPFDSDNNFYDEYFKDSLKDYRIGQLTPLPENKQQLMLIFHSKTRNMIRKAEKSGIQIYKSNNKESIDFLFEVHLENMKSINGTPKKHSFFIELYESFNSKIDIWIAKKNNIKIAALLLINFNNTVEYFTPVIKNEYRSLQPLSLLIYQAMLYSIENKKKWWNWGGTWASQEGVYRFKSRWGTIDMNYYYYTLFNSEDSKQNFLNCSPNDLINNYKYFYTISFHLLKNAN